MKLATRVMAPSKASNRSAQAQGSALLNYNFCKLFTLAICACITSLGLASPLQEDSVPDATRPRPANFKNPVLIEFKGPIDPALKYYFDHKFDKAKAAKADLLIIEIDSPGGLKTQSLEMARRLRDCKWAYTVAIITNEAISGGALVSLGCDEIMIDANAKFGDIGELKFDPEQNAFRLVEPKIESYLSRDARDLAQSKGRSPELAEALVDKDVLVYSKTEGEALQFTSARSDAPIQPAPPWELVPESGPERFLTVSGQRAVSLELAQGDQAQREEVAQEFGFPIETLTTYRYTTTDSIVYILNNPFVTGLLVLLGLIALYFELSSPGMGVGGLLASLAAVLFFWSRFLGGTSGWLEVILFLAGIIFIFAELFVIPGFGVSGIAGLILLLSSIILAGQDFVIPQSTDQWNQTLTSLLVLIGTGILFLIAAIIISKNMGSLPVFNRMILAPPPIASSTASTDKHGKPVVGDQPLVSVGDWGKAESLLRPAGRALFHGRSIDVVSDGTYVEPGTQIRVIEISGNIIRVAMVDPDTPEIGPQSRNG